MKYTQHHILNIYIFANKNYKIPNLKRSPLLPLCSHPALALRPPSWLYWSPRSEHTMLHPDPSAGPALSWFLNDANPVGSSHSLMGKHASCLLELRPEPCLGRSGLEPCSFVHRFVCVFIHSFGKCVMDPCLVLGAGDEDGEGPIPFSPEHQR